MFNVGEYVILETISTGYERTSSCIYQYTDEELLVLVDYFAKQVEIIDIFDSDFARIGTKEKNIQVPLDWLQKIPQKEVIVWWPNNIPVDSLIVIDSEGNFKRKV